MRRRATLIERAVEAIAGRVGAGSAVNRTLRKVFPSHFSFLWGEIALYSLLVLIATGIYLTLFFEGSQDRTIYTGSYVPMRGVEMSAAYESVLRISFDVRAGLLIREIHHWAALVFVAAVGLHMARVFFTGAFRRPRELNWLIGVALLVLALAAGFTGYSLPDDLLSASGLRITHAIVLSIPLVGERLTYLAFGGDWPGTDIIGRLYPVHILVIPVLIGVALAMHLGLVWRQKHTQFPGPGRTEHNVVGERVWPGFAMKSIGLLFLTAGVITAVAALFEVNAVWLYGPYEPAAATSYAQPDWYIGFLEGSLRLMPALDTRIGDHIISNLVYAGILLPGLVFSAVAAVPWFERWLTGDDAEHHLLERPRDAAGRTARGAAGFTFVAVLFVGGSQDVVAGTLDVEIADVTTALRVLLVVAPVLAWWITERVCLALARREAPARTERASTVVRDPAGGYHDDHEVPDDERIRRRTDALERRLIGRQEPPT